MNYTPEQRSKQLGRLKARIAAVQADLNLAIRRAVEHDVSEVMFLRAVTDAGRLSGELTVLKAALVQVNQ